MLTASRSAAAVARSMGRSMALEERQSPGDATRAVSLGGALMRSSAGAVAVGVAPARAAGDAASNAPFAPASSSSPYAAIPDDWSSSDDSSGADSIKRKAESPYVSWQKAMSTLTIRS